MYNRYQTIHLKINFKYGNKVISKNVNEIKAILDILLFRGHWHFDHDHLMLRILRH